MKIVSGGRMTGKTTKAIAWLIERPARVLLVGTQEMARRTTDLFEATGNKGGSNPKVVTWGEAANGALRGRDVEVGIDGLDMFFRQTFGRDVTFVTMDHVEHEELKLQCLHREARAIWIFGRPTPTYFECKDCGERLKVET